MRAKKKWVQVPDAASLLEYVFQMSQAVRAEFGKVRKVKVKVKGPGVSRIMEGDCLEFT